MRLATVLALALFAGTATAQIADGIYESPACTAAPAAEMRIELADGTLRFYESVCVLGPGSPVAGLDGAILYSATCSGEGENWARTILLMPGHDGSLIRVESGLAVTYAPCGKRA